MTSSSQAQVRCRCTLFATLVAGVSSCLLIGCNPGGNSPKDAAAADAVSAPSPDVKANTVDSPLAVDKAKVIDGPRSAADTRTTPDVADSASSGGLDTPLSAADAAEASQPLDATTADSRIQIDAPNGDVLAAVKDAPMADGPSTVDGAAVSDGQATLGALPAVCPAVRAKGGTDLLIDDLATGNGQIALRDGRNGFWFTMADGAEGTLWPTPAAFQTVLGSGPRGGYAARMYGSGFTSWGALLAVSFSQAQTGPCAYDASAFSGVTFWARSATPAIIRVNLATAATQETRDGGACAGTCSNDFGTPIALATVWQKYTIAFTDLTQRNPGSDAATAAFDPTQLTELQFVAASGNAFDISVTDLSFTPAGLFGAHPVELCPDVAFDPTPMPSIPHPAGVTFTIDAANAAKKHTISPGIYGSNGYLWAPSAYLSKDIRRFGHGLLRVEADNYNWEINAANGGYSSSPTIRNTGFPSDAISAGQLVVDGFQAAQASSASLLFQLSLRDYVAGDTAGAMDPNDPTVLSTRFKQNKPAKGAPFSLVPDTADGFVYQDEFVNWVMHSLLANVSVIFQLDAEPEIWDTSSPEIHPNHVSYDEYVNRTVATARAVKAVAPQTEIVGLVAAHWKGLESLSGWSTTGQATAADLAKGPFLEYFLSKLAAEQAKNGVRLVDYIDLHYYTFAQTPSSVADPNIPVLNNATVPPYINSDADIVTTRLQAPRSLWDATYTENAGWEYYGTSLYQQPLTIIPRMKQRIAAVSPGVKVAVTEWDFGGGNHLSGGIVEADVFGIFGREGADVAAHFAMNEWENYGWGAMQAFRSYNRLGGRFGDISISATTSDVAATSVYASLDSQNAARMVIVAINKTSDAVTAAINITGAPASFAKANVFVLAEGASYVKGAPSIASTGSGMFSYTMPRFSVSVLVPKVAGADDELPPYAPDCVRTGNLALSSDFEENAEGWVAFGDAKKSLSTDVAHTGTRSLRVSNRTQTWYGPNFVLALADANTGFQGSIQNGYRYDLSAWVRLGAGAASAPVSWTLATADDAGTHYPASTAQTATSTDWVEVAGSFTPNIVGTLTFPYVSVSGAPIGVDIYIDDVTITATKL
jgi:Glycoside hydrolase family 44/Carbohydrate binding domain